MFELRLTFGPGYRLYFGIENRATLILLTGGTKSSQQRDIERAKSYWTGYLERDNG